jgi:hypothetical protein
MSAINNLKASVSFSVRAEEADSRIELERKITQGKMRSRLVITLQDDRELPSSYKIACYAKQTGFLGFWQRISQFIGMLVPITIGENQEKKTYYLSVLSLILRFHFTRTEILGTPSEGLLSKIAEKAIVIDAKERAISKIQTAVFKLFSPFTQDESRLIALNAALLKPEQENNIVHQIPQTNNKYIGKIEGKLIVGEVGKKIGSGGQSAISSFSYCHIEEENLQVKTTSSKLEYIYKAYEQDSSISRDSIQLVSKLHNAKNIGSTKLIPCPSSDGSLVATLQKYEGVDLIDLINLKELPPIEKLWSGMKASLEQMLSEDLLDIDFKPDNFTWNKKEHEVKRIDLDHIFPIDAPWKYGSPAHTPSYTPAIATMWKKTLDDLYQEVASCESLDRDLLRALKLIKPDLSSNASKEDCLNAIRHEWIQTAIHIAKFQIAISFLLATDGGNQPYPNKESSKDYLIVTDFDKRNDIYFQKNISILKKNVPIKYHEEIRNWLGLLPNQKSPFARMHTLKKDVNAICFEERPSS